MKKFSFIGYLSLGCLLLSALFYGIDYLIFRDAHTLFLYLWSSLAFLPLEIFIVVLIIERIIDQSERKAKLQKLNMVLGAFFNDMGNKLLRGLLDNFNNKAEISKHLNLANSWGKKEFQEADDYAHILKIEIDYRNAYSDENGHLSAAKRAACPGQIGHPI